ncbi:MAG: class I SAM-dependent methyltransferase [Flavobacteriales bacterium]|nr:hypothetical protein [Flavobacteriales bacterium]MCC6576290.1 class I SAM-dependent methyltransferase [Flavobacteriales bacterium]NUQ15275.1 class I SAM-dependent methyltransferase [Flavobacteriales bacterium]
MPHPDHALLKELVSLGIVREDTLEPFHPQVRDRSDVSVWRCPASGVLLLDRIDQIGASYYPDQDGLSYWDPAGRAQGLVATREDDLRRATSLTAMVAGKRYVDIGTGLGGVLDLVRPVCASVAAVEPQAEAARMLRGLGYDVHPGTGELAATGQRFDVASLFHVFEHMTGPLKELRTIHALLEEGGRIVVEVPHARDALITQFACMSFRQFTFWSEHLVLHTRASLAAYLQVAGFKDVQVSGVQRYPLANHLFWLSHGGPGGQVRWPELRSGAVEEAYAALLQSADLTDTLVAVGTK